MLPPRLAAVLALGLRDASRVKLKLAGADMTTRDMLLASISDKLSLLLWINSEDGLKGINRPNLILDNYQGAEKEHMVFDSASEFEAMRQKLIERGG